MSIMAMTIAPWPVIGARAALVVAGIALWYWTQAVLAKRVPTKALLILVGVVLTLTSSYSVYRAVF